MRIDMREGVRITLCAGLVGTSVAAAIALFAGPLQADDPEGRARLALFVRGLEEAG